MPVQSARVRNSFGSPASGGSVRPSTTGPYATTVSPTCAPTCVIRDGKHVWMTRTEEVKVMNGWFDQHLAGKPPAAVVPVPQNSSTVHRGQLPSPGTWGATERAGLCPEVPAERTDWKPELRCLRHHDPQVAGVGVPGRGHAAGEAAYPSDEAPLVSFVSDSPQRLRPPTSPRLDANSPSRGFSFRLTGWECGPEHAGQ
jgi:hypothetical protein